MKLKRYYVVSKHEESGLWYAHKRGFPNIPIMGSFRKSKRAAQKVAADHMGLPLKEYYTIPI